MPPHLVFGAGAIGTTAKSFTFTWDTPEKVNELLHLLKNLDILELDSAASYPPGNPENAETLLGQSQAAEMGFLIDSKIAVHPVGVPHLTAEGINTSTARTLELLKTDKVRTLYAHAPEKTTPLEVTAAAFQRQFEEGRFDRLGLCSYNVDDLTQYLAICEEKGYVKPTIYQGCYNALYRSSEKELVPFLRKHGIAYYVFSPLAGGFLTGKVTAAIDNNDESELHRTRWRGESVMEAYPLGFEKPEMHEAIRKLRGVCEKEGLSLAEVSLRWLMHHSVLREGDGIIFGAKTLEQLEGNVRGARGGPLRGEVLRVVEGLWGAVGGEGENGKA